MKKTLLLFLLVLPFFGFAQLAAGSHVIGVSQPAPYTTLQTAITSLNTGGITGTGDVTLLLNENQIVATPIVISRADLTATKGLIIKPNTNADITISGNLSGNAVIALNGADYVTIDGNNGTADNKLKIYNTFNDTNNSYTNRMGVWLYGVAENNTFKNLTIQLNIVDVGVGVYSTGILAGNSTIGGSENNSKNTISNVNFTNVKQAILVRGTSQANSNWTITNNKIGSTTDATKPFLGIYMLNTSNYTVSNNVINGVKLPNNVGGSVITHSGIYLETANTGVVSGNTVSNVTNDAGGGFGYGICVKGNNAIISQNNVSSLNSSVSNGSFGIRSEGNDVSIYGNKISSIFGSAATTSSGIYIAGNNQLLYNNFVNDVASAGGGSASTQDGFGIYINSGSNIKLYHNSVRLITNQTSGSSAPLYIKDGSALDVRNNIFANTQTSGSLRFAIFLAFSDFSKFSFLNYNDYYSTSNLGCAGDYNTTSNRKSDLAAWQAAAGTGKDDQSKSLAPLFLSSTDLHLATNNTNNNLLKGITISDVISDIDNNIRTFPYMGAHELNGCTPTGDQVTYGLDYWKGYVYTYTGTTAAATTYVGSIAEKATFDRNVDTGSITGDATVEANALCIAPSDKFMVRYLLQTTLTSATAGAYNVTIGGDDGVRLYIDGTLVNVSPTGSWGGHAYTNYATQVNLSAGLHKFILEYYEDDRSSRVSFSYGRVQVGTTPPLSTYPFGDNKWNVYGFTLPDITLPTASYAGMYVDTNLNINTQTFWNNQKSPSDAAGWQGAPMGIDNFAITYKRQGFPCGVYKIDLVNVDDDAEVYINGTKIYTRTGYSGSSLPVISSQFLNQSSTVEVRLREAGGAANLALSFTDTPVVYNGTGAIPASSTSIKISANSTLANDIEVCSCTVDAGITFTIPADITLTVDENIIVTTTGANVGKLVLQNGASLIQKNTASTAYQGASNTFEMQRNTSLIRRYDWTYWSSPVKGFTLYNLSPLTLADKYNSYDAVNSKWTYYVNGAQEMLPAIGYTVRAPQTYSITSGQIYNAKFIGVPNNGNYTVQVYANKFSLIGNPYPSAIDADKLISVNSAANVPVGALYFWTHNSAAVGATVGNGNTSYTSDDYAVYSKTGGIATARASTDTTNNTEPLGKIAAGQSFFILGSVPGLVTFTNDMRISANNKQFYKTAESNSTEKNRLWLNLSNADGAFKQTLVGYIGGATNDLDIDYDASTMDSNSYVDFYSINDANKLTIQGRALPFDDSDRIPLGYKTTIAGDFNIGIDHADGLFDNQDVYLEDKTTGKVQDLRAGDYTFTTEIGTFTDRFTISYVKKTLGTGDFENLENSVLVSVKSKAIKVTSTKENINEVTIYDITGRILYNKKKVESTELPISNLQSSNQVLLVKVKLENDYMVTKKIIFN